MLASLLVVAAVAHGAADSERGSYTDVLALGAGLTVRSTSTTGDLAVSWRHGWKRSASVVHATGGIGGDGGALDLTVGLDFPLVASALHGLSVGPRLGGEIAQTVSSLHTPRAWVMEPMPLGSFGIGGAIGYHHVFEPGFPAVGVWAESKMLAVQGPVRADWVRYRFGVELGGALGEPGRGSGPIADRAPWLLPVTLTVVGVGGIAGIGYALWRRGGNLGSWL